MINQYKNDNKNLEVEIFKQQTIIEAKNVDLKSKVNQDKDEAFPIIDSYLFKECDLCEQVFKKLTLKSMLQININSPVKNANYSLIPIYI